MSKTTFIYALCEPGTRTVRYIGKANDPKHRYHEHLVESIKCATFLGRWIKRVLRDGKVPNLVLLAKVPRQSWQIEERRYIAAARMLGMKLVNTTDGGDGVTQTPEVRKKIGDSLRGRKHSPARCKQNSEIRTGRKLPKAHCLAIGRGVRGTRHSPEMKQRCRLSKLGEKNPMFGKFGSEHHLFGTKREGASSKFLGVFWHCRRKKWLVIVCKQRFGSFELEIDAAKAADIVIIKLYGPSAKTNFP